jgi:leader peptidase (prepilin peptidase)/N-methyltransferase
MGSVLAAGAVAGAGIVAGAGGATLLRRIPRPVPVPAPVCVAGVAGLWSVVGARLDRLPVWWWPVPLVLAWAAVLLAAADVVARRLPDALTLPAYPVAAGLLGIAALGAGNADLPARSLIGALLWAGGYATVRLVSPGALGGGDVKLAGSLGALTAATSWPALLLAVLLATALTALIAGPARLLGRRDVPHGPAMVAAAWLVVLQPPS